MTETRNQNFILFVVLNFEGFLFLMIRTDRIKMEAPNATTPPSFDGMDRSTTYANKKYHSG